jgi:hypothetical protein
MPLRAVKDAFGAGSPNWNVPFPSGNLTAAEILAYLPHALKSVDVIDRFLMNGASSQVIAKTLSEFRNFPGGKSEFPANSVHIMMKDAMRRAGYDLWTVNSHQQLFSQTRFWDSGYLSVARFRTPRITHPKVGLTSRNLEAPPVEFRDLACHVKKHPSGRDALDLTRCVLYAVEHPKESWKCPTDFARLVEKIGGPSAVTTDHTDTALFQRRSLSLVNPILHLSATPVSSSLQKVSSAANFPPQRNSLLMPLSSLGNNLTSVNDPVYVNMAATRDNSTAQSASWKKRGRLAKKAKIDNELEDDILTTTRSSERRSGRLAKKESIDYGSTEGRKSERLRNKPLQNLREISEDASPVSVRTRASDNDYLEDLNEDGTESDADPDVVDEDEDSVFGTPTPATRSAAPTRKMRRAAKVSMRKTRELASSFHSSPIKVPIFEKPAKTFNPEIEEAARLFVRNKPTAAYLPALALSRDRITIDKYNVLLYAEEGVTDLWASALSYSRFRGPRRSPPFRELHRLTEPDKNDISDWAENIRWAKEQFKHYGSIWTEYDYDLEIIQQHRRDIMWASEEWISSGRMPSDSGAADGFPVF